MGGMLVMWDGIGHWAGMQRAWRLYMVLFVLFMWILQVLRYFDYVFTGVFTFEMVIKVRTEVGLPHTSLPQGEGHSPGRRGGRRGWVKSGK